MIAMGVMSLTFGLGFGGFLALHFGSWQPLRGIIYLVSGVFLMFGGGWTGCYFLLSGLRLLQRGRSWREQATGRVTIRGAVAYSWADERLGRHILAKVQPKAGESKVLLVPLELLESLPEEVKEVEIEYRLGCEAVVGFKALSDTGNAAQETEDEQEDEEG
jgi:hypothetical protein